MDMAWAPNSQPRLILIPQLDEADERLAELRKELAEVEAVEEEWAHGVAAEAAQVAALEEAFTKQVRAEGGGGDGGWLGRDGTEGRGGGSTSTRRARAWACVVAHMHAPALHSHAQRERRWIATASTTPRVASL